MMMTNDFLNMDDIDYMTSKEKDEVIYSLREKVIFLESQKNSYKNLSEELQFMYERMRELYSVVQDKCEQLKADNKLLVNDLEFFRYQLGETGSKFGDSLFTEQNLIENRKQQTLESPLTKKHGGNLNQSSSSYGFNLVSAAVTNNGNPSAPALEMNNPSKIKLTKQYSQHSQSSNNPNTANNLDGRKIGDGYQQEESENIELGLTNQKSELQKKFSNAQILPNLAGPLDSQHYNDKYSFNNEVFLDEESKLAAMSKYREKAKIGDLLFQDFVMIGPSMDELFGKCQIGEGGINKSDDNRSSQNGNQGAGTNAKNLNDQEEGMFSQDILFNLFENKLDDSWKAVISKYPFPFRIKCKKHRFKKTEEFQSEIYKKIFTEHKVQDIGQFVFQMIGENNNSSQKEKVPIVLEGSNPKQSLYCVYFLWEDYIVTEKEKNTLFKCPFAFCFVTYYPFFSFFREVLCHILSKMQEKRIPLIKLNLPNIQDKKNVSNLPAKIQSQDITWIISGLQSYTKYLLEVQLKKPEIQQTIDFSVQEETEIDSSDTLHLQGDPSPRVNSLGHSKLHNSPDSSSKVSFMVPHFKQLRLLETSQYSGSNLIFERLTFEDFWFLLTLMMLEQNIAFYSENIYLVSAAMQTFASIYKPFTKCNLPVLPLFEDNLTFLESPFPFMSGINQNRSFIKKYKIICKDSSLVNFIDLDKKEIFMSDDTMRLFEDQNCYMNYTKYMYQLRKSYSILKYNPYHTGQNSMIIQNPQNKQVTQSLTISNFSFSNHSMTKLFNSMIYQQPNVPPSIVQSFRMQQQQSSIIGKGLQDGKNQPKSSSNIGGIPSSSQLVGKGNITDIFNDKGLINYALDKGNISRNQVENSEEAKFILDYQKTQFQVMMNDLKSKALDEIHELLELTFQYYIIDNMPRDVNIDTFNFNNIHEYHERVLKKCEEKSFTSEFFKTQTFSYFFQQFYEKPTTASTKASNSYPSTANPENKY